MKKLAGLAMSPAGVARIKRVAQQRGLKLLHIFQPVRTSPPLLPLGWFAGINFACNYDACEGLLVDAQVIAEIDLPGLIATLGPKKTVQLVGHSDAHCTAEFSAHYAASERHWLAETDFRQALFPRVISICVLENKCFAKCRFCPQTRNVTYARNRAMDVRLFEQIIRQIPNQPGYTVRFAVGGEPLTFPLLHQWVGKMKASKPAVLAEYASNGVLLDQVNCKEMVASQLDHLLVSLNAPTRSDYAWFTGIDAFDRVIANLRLLMDEKRKQRSVTPLVVVKINALKRWAEALPGSVEMLGSLVDRVQVEPVLFCQHDDDLANAAEHEFHPLPLVPTCTYLNHVMTILPDGSVEVCCATEFTGEKTPTLGNLRDSSIAEIWNGMELTQLRQANARGKSAIVSCRACAVNRPDFETDLLIKAKQRQ